MLTQMAGARNCGRRKLKRTDQLATTAARMKASAKAGVINLIFFTPTVLQLNPPPRFHLAPLFEAPSREPQVLGIETGCRPRQRRTAQAREPPPLCVSTSAIMKTSRPTTAHPSIPAMRGGAVGSSYRRAPSAADIRAGYYRRLDELINRMSDAFRVRILHAPPAASRLRLPSCEAGG